MKEIWAPEAVIVVFLGLPLFRPFFKSLHQLDGLTWLPLIALSITAGIFPAYGFRPECLPTLVAALFINVVVFSFGPGDAFRDRPPLLTTFSLVLLTVAAVPMFTFSPRVYEAKGTPPPVRTLSIETPDREYVLRVYGTVESGARAEKPLIFIVPPELGSAASVDMVCRELWQNFTVITYSRKGYDTPHTDKNGKRRPASPSAQVGRWRVFRNAADRSSFNEQGKDLEAERRSDLEFLLPRLPALLGATGHGDLPPLLLAGFGAGGSALAYMAGEDGFTARYGKALGAVAIESRLWSSYQSQDRLVPQIPPSAGIVQRQWALFVNRLHNMRPLRVERTGPLPSAGLPVMYLVSGRALDGPRGQKPYQAVFDALRTGPGPVALAAVESAGPLDYQDYPFTRPLYSFLLPGRIGAKKSKNPIGDTAGVIGNFAVYLLDQTRQTGATTPPRQAIGGNLYVENRGLPGFR